MTDTYTLNERIRLLEEKVEEGRVDGNRTEHWEEEERKVRTEEQKEKESIVYNSIIYNI